MRKGEERLEDLVHALIALLETENDALARMELEHVVGSINLKRGLIERLAAAAGTPGGVAPDPSLRRRLDAATRRNAALLDAAMLGQRNLMRILGSAIRGADTRQVYTRDTQSAPLPRTRGLAIATSA